MIHKRSFVPAAALAILLAFSADDAEACSCMYMNMVSSYNMADDVAVARVVFGVKAGGTQWYIARVRLGLKGCLKKGQWIYVKTSASSASCGVTLQEGKSYVLTGSLADSAFGTPVLGIAMCSTQKLVGEVTKAELSFLLGRYNCCGDKCACVNGEDPVMCFVDPCVVSSCPAGECTANYCGGCNAEHYDANGFMVCGPCANDMDCGFDQACVDGMCTSGCETDEDCNEGFFCSPAAPGTSLMQCKPYQQEGEPCGGYTPIWAQMKCAPGLLCKDAPPFIADAPGKCRKPCKTNNGCLTTQYCAGDGVCRDDGTCLDNDDCNMAGNDYSVLMCIGYGECMDSGQCKFICGTKPDLKWYSTCGKPVCGPYDEPPPGTPKCKEGQKMGAPCSDEGATCDAGLGCGSVLVCAQKDPKLSPGGCPISKAEHKTDIRYLAEGDLKALYDEVVGMRLARWRYKESPAESRPRLGFIIDDQPASPSVAADGRQVDVYAFTSMAVAALQVQARQIEDLKKQVDELKKQLEAR